MLLAFALPTQACDLSLERRSTAVADYVREVAPCVTQMPLGYGTDAALEREFLYNINAERRSAGLPPLKIRQELVDGARFHSLDMAANRFFGHEGPDGRMPGDRISAFDRRALIDYASENVAMVEVSRGKLKIADPSAHLHQNLMESPPHRKNILNPAATHVAIGVVRTESGVWVTQVFLSLIGTLDQDAPLIVRHGDKVGLRAMVSDWTFRNFEAEQPGERHKPFSPTGPFFGVPEDVTGDFMLTAYCDRAGQRRGQIVSIRFAGPAMTVKGS